MFYPPNVAEIAGPGLVVSDKRRIMERKRQEKSYLELARRVLLRNDASENPCQYTAVRCSGRVFPVTVDRTTDVFDLASFVVHQMGIGKSVEDGRVTPHLEFNGKPLDNYSLKVLPLCRDSRGFFELILTDRRAVHFGQFAKVVNETESPLKVKIKPVRSGSGNVIRFLKEICSSPTKVIVRESDSLLVPVQRRSRCSLKSSSSRTPDKVQVVLNAGATYSISENAQHALQSVSFTESDSKNLSS